MAQFMLDMIPRYSPVTAWGSGSLRGTQRKKRIAIPRRTRGLSGYGAKGLENAAVVVEPMFQNGNAEDRKSTRLNSSHSQISYAVFCLKKKKDSISIPGIMYGAKDPHRSSRYTY